MQQATHSPAPSSDVEYEASGSKSIADSMQQAPDTLIATNLNGSSTPVSGSTLATLPASNAPATSEHLPQASLPWPDIVFVKFFADHHPAPCYRLCEEVDTLTLWAFLLSIIHAAFVVVGLQGLTRQPDGLSTEYLREILALVNNSRATMNSTAAATLEPALIALEGLLVERQNVTSLAHDVHVGVNNLNAFWLAGLALSLASLLVAMMCRQCLRELVLARRLHGPAHNTSASSPAHNNPASSSAYGAPNKFPAIMYFWVSVLITSCAPALLQLACLLFIGGAVQSGWQQLRPAFFERIPSLVGKHIPPSLLVYLPPTLLEYLPRSLLEHLPSALLEHLPSVDAVFAGVLPLVIDLAIEVLHARTSRKHLSTPPVYLQAPGPEPVPAAPRRRIGRSRVRRAALKTERYGVKSSAYRQHKTSNSSKRSSTQAS